MQVTMEGKVAVEQAQKAAETVREGTDTAVHKASAAAKQVQAEVQANTRGVSTRVSSALQQAKSGAEERLGLLSRRVSDTAGKTWSTAVEQAQQAAVPVQAAALRARSATMRSAQRSAAVVRSVVTAAKQVCLPLHATGFCKLSPCDWARQHAKSERSINAGPHEMPQSGSVLHKISDDASNRNGILCKGCDVILAGCMIMLGHPSMLILHIFSHAGCIRPPSGYLGSRSNHPSAGHSGRASRRDSLACSESGG